jgi:hypothetical protein
MFSTVHVVSLHGDLGFFGLYAIVRHAGVSRFIGRMAGKVDVAAADASAAARVLRLNRRARGGAGGGRG